MRRREGTKDDTTEGPQCRAPRRRQPASALELQESLSPGGKGRGVQEKSSSTANLRADCELVECMGQEGKGVKERTVKGGL